MYFYYSLSFGINDNFNSDKQSIKLELDTIDYHTKHDYAERNYRT